MAKHKRRQTLRTIYNELSLEDEGLSLDWLRGVAKRGDFPKTPQPKGKPALVDASEVLNYLREQNLTGKPGRPAEHGEDGDELRAAKILKERALAERYRLIAEREAGRLVSAAAVTQVMGKAAIVLRQRLMSIPSQVAPRITPPDRVPEAIQELDQAIREALTELSKGFDTGLRTAQEAERSRLE